MQGLMVKSCQVHLRIHQIIDIKKRALTLGWRAAEKLKLVEQPSSYFLTPLFGSDGSQPTTSMLSQIAHSHSSFNMPDVMTAIKSKCTRFTVLLTASTLVGISTNTGRMATQRVELGHASEIDQTSITTLF